MIHEQEVVMKQLTRVVSIFVASECAIRPHFMLVGPSGSGKSHLVQKLAEDHKIDFLEINAAQLTKEGTSGNSLSKALAPLAQKAGPTLVFVDEFDKLFISGNQNSSLAHETTNGVQNEFLKVLESKSTSVFGDYGKYSEVSTEKVLFVFAGAFNGEDSLTLDRLREFGIKTEFLGRVGLIYNLTKLSIESMRQALDESKLLDHYLKLFPKVNKEDVTASVMQVVQENYDKNTLGIRLLNTLLHQFFIGGGKLMKENQKKVTFQKTLELVS